MIDTNDAMARTTARMDNDDRRLDWFRRHHRLAEQLIDRPTGGITHPTALRPGIDFLCADSLSAAKADGGAMWNHSAWVIEAWHRIHSEGQTWWPDLPTNDGVVEATCPLCDDACRYQVKQIGPHYLQREDAEITFVPWPLLIDAAVIWFQGNLPNTISPVQDETVEDFVARHLPTFEELAQDGGGLPTAYGVVVSDAFSSRSRHLLYTLDRAGTQLYAVRGVFEDEPSMTAWRVAHLGVRDGDELNGDDLRKRLSSARSARSTERQVQKLIREWRGVK